MLQARVALRSARRTCPPHSAAVAPTSRARRARTAHTLTGTTGAHGASLRATFLPPAGYAATRMTYCFYDSHYFISYACRGCISGPFTLVVAGLNLALGCASPCGWPPKRSRKSSI